MIDRMVFLFSVPLGASIFFNHSNGHARRNSSISLHRLSVKFHRSHPAVWRLDILETKPGHRSRLCGQSPPIPRQFLWSCMTAWNQNIYGFPTAVKHIHAPPFPKALYQTNLKEPFIFAKKISTIFFTTFFQIMESFLESKRCTAFCLLAFCDTHFCVIYSHILFCYLRFAVLLFFVLSKKQNLPYFQTHFFQSSFFFCSVSKAGH